MQTITAYTFDELSEQAKQRVINRKRKNLDSSSYYDEAYQSVKAFHNIFGTKEWTRSWLNVRTGHLDDTLTEMRGQRAANYIWNNYKTDLFKGKYYSLWSKTEVSYKHYPKGYPVLKSRYSRITLNTDCVLTGVCYDNDLLDPIYNFLNKPDESMTFEELINDCFHSLTKALENEDDYRYSEDGIREECIDDLFTENGNDL